MIVVCHYGEIGLKGKNRKFFEERLVKNIKKALPKGSFSNVKRISGRILINANGEKAIIKEALKNVFGLVNFSFGISCEQSIEVIKQKAVELLKDIRFQTFRVSATRSNKSFPLTSQQINEIVGAWILGRSSTPSKVSLEKPDVVLFIEVVDNYALLFTEKIRGQGGLPVGVSGRAVSLISGGIDSPVASFLAMKRGLEIIFVHFHALPFVDKASVEKVKELVRVLKKHQGNSKLYLAPFAEIQKEILLKTKEGLRVVLYRRLMFHIAQEIAKREKAFGLITGENLGQVASQTIENIAVIESGLLMPVLRPLIMYDKAEIIQKAKEIGTFELSIQEHQDCCSRFLPKHPEIRANLKEVLQEEKKIKIKKLVSLTLKNLTIEEI